MHVRPVLFRQSQLRRAAAATVFAVASASALQAQQSDFLAGPKTVQFDLASLEPTTLPDSPGTVAAALAQPAADSSSFDTTSAAPQITRQPSLNPNQPPAQPSVARPTDMNIIPGQTGPHQTVHDKLVGSARDSITPFSFGGYLISAGYSQLVDSSPNYDGPTAPAFGQRFGAATARGVSQNLFYKGAMASILHQDPRYYQLGSQQPFVKRVLYAGTRVLVGRTDSGRTTPNLALLTGYLGAAFLTRAYYPSRNQTVGDNLATFGSSIGGSAIGFEVNEFIPNVLQVVHLKKVLNP